MDIEEKECITEFKEREHGDRHVFLSFRGDLRAARPFVESLTLYTVAQPGARSHVSDRSRHRGEGAGNRLFQGG